MQGLKTKQYKTSSKNDVNDIKFKKSGAKDKWSRNIYVYTHKVEMWLKRSQLEVKRNMFRVFLLFFNVKTFHIFGFRKKCCNSR